MNALILGGESPRHQTWVRQVADALRLPFEKVVFVDYKHWPEKAETDIAHEINAASEAARDLGEYVVIAKSIGTAITALAIKDGKLRPVRCVFLGFPLRGIVRRMAAEQEWLADLPPTVFVQNEHDPTGAAEDVAAYLKTAPLKQYRLHVLPNNDTHDYTDLDLITRFATAQAPAE